jgi:putative ABC transport system permease protein
VFSLEHAIATWRQTLSRRKEFLPDDLDELEQHIRDEVATRVAAGSATETAYRETMARMGDHGEVEDAYRRVYWGKLNRQGLVATTILSELFMIRNYLLLALRNLARYPGYTFINIAGLAVGIACCLLILLFVQDERSYDQFHERSEDIVRVTLGIPDRDENLDVTPTIVAPLFKRTFAEVEDATRIYNISRFRSTIIRNGDTAWEEKQFVYADSTVFNVLTFPFIQGDPRTALVRPGTLVLTESAALKYFGSVAEAMGGRLVVGTDAEFEVTGILEDVPANSHIQFDVMASFASTWWANQEIWGSANFQTYLLLHDRDGLENVRRQTEEMLTAVRAEMGVGPGFGLGFERLEDIYLVHMGRARYVRMFTGLALLILFIACVNYVNLATARSARRSREVGMRKVLGADRAQIMRQFFGESALVAGIALLLGIGLAVLALPLFSDLANKSLSLATLNTARSWLAVAGLMALVTAAAGLYPALVLSSFEPVRVLKGGRTTTGGNALFRKVLVVFQFGITVFLLVATTVVFKQLRFVQNTDVGYDREQVVAIPLSETSARRAIPALRSTLLENVAVQSVSAVNAIPGRMMGGYRFATPATINDDDTPMTFASPVDPHVVETLGLELLSGDGFKDVPDLSVRPDSGRYQYIINEQLMRVAGWTPETAIGQRMTVSGSTRMGDVVGVVRDFNFLDLRTEIRPQALFIEPEYNVLLVKLSTSDLPGTLSFVQRSWSEMTGGSPWSYTFLDDAFSQMYDAEQRLAGIFSSASILAVLIACLGLVGLASFTTEQRTKEIGVRKVLGATSGQVVLLLNRDMTLWVIVGAVLALPAAWWAMDTWLGDFAYRTELSWWTFAGAAAVAALMAWLTVSWQSYRAATTDPVTAIRFDQ